MQINDFFLSLLQQY